MVAYLAVTIESVEKTSLFRGFIIQSRESTPTYDRTAAFAGKFINTGGPGDDLWKTVSCNGSNVRNRRWSRECLACMYKTECHDHASIVNSGHSRSDCKCLPDLHLDHWC